MAISGVDRYDHVNSEAVYGSLTVGTTAVELKVGGSALDGRQLVTMQPTNNKIYWGYSNAVTTSTGTRVFKDQFLPLAVGADIAIWVIADVAGRTLRIAELA